MPSELQPVAIRPALPADAGEVSQMVRNVLRDEGLIRDAALEYPQFLRPDAILFRLQRGSLCLVALDRDPLGREQIVGVVEIEELTHLSLLCVDAGHRGRGLARGLWEQARGFCREFSPGPQRFSVQALRSALPVYRRFGFVECGPPQGQHGFELIPMELICDEPVNG